ncbi:hypothetical protein E2562_028664, partial [Oryza meyeriana var. granulata]
KMDHGALVKQFKSKGNSGLLIDGLHIIMDDLSAKNFVHGLRVLQESKATPTSDAKTEAIDFEESEFTRSGSMRFELNDYPGSGANNRHSPHSEGTR